MSGGGEETQRGGGDAEADADAPAEPDDAAGSPPEQDGAPTEPRDRTVLYQLLGGAVALVAVTAVAAVVLTRAMLLTPPPEAEGRLRGTGMDAFNRADGSALEVSETGRPWQVVSGEWTVKDNAVSVKPATGPAGGSALALLDPGVPDQYVQATFTDPTPGSGLVTRFSGPNNFIGVSFAPVSGTVQLIITVDGTRAEPTKVGSAPPDGDVVLGVRTEGQNVIVYVNGAETGRQVVPELADATRVGVLIRGGGDGPSVVDDVVAVPLSSEPLGALGAPAGDQAGGEDGEPTTTAAPGDEEETTTSEAPASPEPTGGAGAPTPGALQPAENAP
ncbi:MAG: hypothetical protein R2754_02130 [Microthrixaceae bacterium]